MPSLDRRKPENRNIWIKGNRRINFHERRFHRTCLRFLYMTMVDVICYMVTKREYK